MKFSLIVCTFMRAKPLLRLLKSVDNQTVYPDEILIIDGSLDNETKNVLSENEFKKLQYFLVSNENRGLTKQRNFGIDRVASDSEVVCFLDDDTILENNYFEELLNTYKHYPDAVGAGGYIANEINWQKAEDNYKPSIKEFYFDGWVRKDGSRFVMRKKLNLDSDCLPGFLPAFSHGRSISFLPPSDKIYQVEQLMGGVSSFKKSVFDKFSFSTYFEGYGLYEDADFSIRVAKSGKLFINTAAKLDHFHEESGRPNKYKYGKMVVRNGWYVWRVKNSNPKFIDCFKWNLITILLILIRFSNAIGGNDKIEATKEALGRTIGFWSLIFNKPVQK
jgi:GT2 family glycosyltransferase